METVGGRVKADIERGFAAVDQFPDFRLVRDLRDKSPRPQFLIDSHDNFPFSRIAGTGNAPCPGSGQRANGFAVPPLLRRPLAERGLMGRQHAPAL